MFWGDIALPDWDETRFFNLFRKVRGGRANAAEKDEHARLLMVLFCAHMTRGLNLLVAKLRQQQMDIESVAAEVLRHAVQKTTKIKLRDRTPRVLVEYYHSLFRHKITSMLRTNAGRPLLDSDSQDLGPDGEERLPKIPSRADVNEWRVCEGLREAEERIADDAFQDARSDGRNPHPRWLLKLYRLCYITLFRRNTFPPYEELPARLRRQITHEDHAYIVYRIVQHVESLALEQ